MAATTPPPPPPMTPVPPKKKTSPLVWVAVGCGVILVLVLLVVLVGGFFVARGVKGAAENPALFAAKLAAAADPDIEVVSSDQDEQTVTLRNKKTGQTITVNAEDIRKGRLKFTDEKGEEVTFEASGEGEEGTLRIQSGKGEMTFGAGSETRVPAWLPMPSGVDAEGMYSATTEDGVQGGFGFKTSESIDEVIGFYKGELEAKGFKVSHSSFNQDGKVTGAMLVGEKDGGDTRVQVNLGEDEGRTGVSVVYQAKK